VQFNPFLDAQIEVPRILLQVLQKLRAVWKVGVAGRHRQTGQPGYMLQRMQSQAVVMVMPRLADATPVRSGDTVDCGASVPLPSQALPDRRR
jgi:hypothetical protein